MSEANGAAAQGNEGNGKAAKAKTEYTKVTMGDGREVEFAGKQLLKKAFTCGEDSVTATFDFRNGETRSIKVDASDMPMLLQMAGHGALQKIGDETAGVKNEDGSPDLDSQVIAVDAIIARLSGQGSIEDRWYAERAAGDGFSGASVVIKAIAEARGDAFKAKGETEKAEAAYKDIAWVKKFLEDKLAADKAAGGTLTRQKLYQSFRKEGTKTAVIIERLEKEKKQAAPAIDADAELAQMVN